MTNQYNLDHIKQPIQSSLKAVSYGQALAVDSTRTKGWPCEVVSVNGSIVTVQFQVTSQWTLPNVTMPVFGPEYIRYPIQVGCKGMAVPADTSLGAMSGLGAASPPLVGNATNLTNLVFLPIGNSNWTPPVDANKLEMYGPNGVLIHSVDETLKILLDSVNKDIALTSVSGGVTLEVLINQSTSTVEVSAGAVNIQVTPTLVTINGNLQVNGTITGSSTIADHKSTMDTMRSDYNSHDHTINNVQTGTTTVTSNGPSVPM